MNRYLHSPTAIVLTPLPRGPFLELGGFSRGYESVLPSSVIQSTSFSLPDTRSIFWKNRNTTLTHSTLTRRAGRNSRRRLYRSYWGAFDQLIRNHKVTLGRNWL